MGRLLIVLAALAAGPLPGDETVDRVAAKAELNRIADAVFLPRAFNLIHKLVAPSVVSIHITTHQVGLDPVRRRLERREVNLGEGSGFIFHADGEASFVLTNAHVVLQRNELGEFVRNEKDEPVWQPKVRIVLNDNRSYEATPVGADPETDLAVLSIPEADLPTVEWGDSDAVEVGDPVLALGYPLGVGYTASSGIISATGRSTGIYRTEHGYEAFLQTDAAINPGNSGGPLVNLRGRIIGVNSNILSAAHGRNIGVNFAISSNLARNVAEDLRDDGKVARPMLGIRMDQLSNPEAERLAVPGRRGVKVEWVMPKSPAAIGGLQAGDVVLDIAGAPVSGIQQFRTRVASLAIGDEISVNIWRGGEKRLLTVKPISWDAFHRMVMEDLKRQAVGLDGFGLHVSDDSFLGVPVVAVAEDSPAARGGLLVGDRILRVDGVGGVSKAAEIAALDDRDEVVLEIFRNRKILLLRLRKQADAPAIAPMPVPDP